MEYIYWLPDENGVKDEKKTQNNAVIIVGANGSGKSKLGAWIEKLNLEGVHRIGAQRNLNFNENIQLKSYSEAKDYFFYGHINHNKNMYRWANNHYTTTLINDYDYVLAALLAIRNNENDNYIKLCKEAEKKKQIKPDVPETTIDKLINIWDEVLPHRTIFVDDSKFYAKVNKDRDESKYIATEMSDGERAVLYLTAQVLCVPQKKILIIDEPEIHLHRSIMDRLWITLEKYRQDCLFIYITHDLDFAAAHGNADKYWVKEFNGTNKWVYDKIESSDNLPEKLMLEILGSRRSVLFVEGDRNSYDFQLYSKLFSKYLVIPCGGCPQVIARTKAFNSSPMLHGYKVYGLIDRDYRSDTEINSYKNSNIYVLNVAEVENLFLVEEVIRIIAKQFGDDEADAFHRVKDFVINTKYSNMIDHQICQCAVYEMKYRLSCIEISKTNDADVKRSIQEELNKIDYDDIRREKEKVFYNALDNKDYKEVLRIFNEKGIAAEVGRLIGIEKREYQRKVINLLQGDCNEALVAAIKNYLPAEIPM